MLMRSQELTKDPTLPLVSLRKPLVGDSEGDFQGRICTVSAWHMVLDEQELRWHKDCKCCENPTTLLPHVRKPKSEALCLGLKRVPFVLNMEGNGVPCHVQIQNRSRCCTFPEIQFDSSLWHPLRSSYTNTRRKPVYAWRDLLRPEMPNLREAIQG